MWSLKFGSPPPSGVHYRTILPSLSVPRSTTTTTTTIATTPAAIRLHHLLLHQPWASATQANTHGLTLNRQHNLLHNRGAAGTAQTQFSQPGPYNDLYERSLKDPSGFWAEQAHQVAWIEKPPASSILSKDSNGISRWFKGGKCNMSHMALDTQIAQGRGDQLAYIWDSPVTKQIKKYTYKQVLKEVEKLAGVLRSQGIKQGDAVVVYMPMIPETAFAMLACNRIGAIHSVVFGGFAPQELATRLRDVDAKLVLTASCGVEVSNIIPYKPFVDKALSIAFPSGPRPNVVLVDRPQGPVNMKLMNSKTDFFYHELMADSRIAPVTEPVILDATDPLYVIYTSGTTGKPKGLVRDVGGYAVALKWSMPNLFNTHPGETFWAASDFGWVVGHSYITYAPLLNGSTGIIYEGKPVRTPDAGALWRVISQHNVQTLFIAPTAFRAVKKEDPKATLQARYDISCLKQLLSAGERLDPPTFHWLRDILPKHVPIVDNWWQTETGWPILCSPIGVQRFPVKPGSASFPAPGYDIDIFEEGSGTRLVNVTGDVCIKLPLPPGACPTIWRGHDRYKASYLEKYPGYYLTGDNGYKDNDGYVFILGRIDDVINVAGHRFSTGELEEVIGAHEAVAECAVIGVEDSLKGCLPVALVVLKDGHTLADLELEKALVALVRNNIGAIACLKSVLVVPRLPKTRSGKILRNTIRKITMEANVAAPATIDDPAIITEIREVFKRRKIGPLYCEED
eukprot:gb/GEZN01002359.1/.p1 GENE.gb/GEZN01002359.1/~~gb/GEZN01002359.1/.p1  ORF type:complete len:746 (+),score=76.21 gb/GEZN01002359.1/:27-2240(+)